MRSQSDEAAVEDDLTFTRDPLQSNGEDRHWQSRLQQQPQLFPADALKVWVLSVIIGKLRHQA